MKTNRQMEEDLAATRDETITITCVAAGDNIIHKPVYRSYALPEGGYNFLPAYQQLRAVVEKADVAFLNQESVCGGSSLGISDFPQFNSPYEVLDAVAQTGFNWINTASNHSLDRGPVTLLSQLARITEIERITQTGTNAVEADADAPTVLNIHGLRVGLASYTYGINASALPKGRDYLVNLYDEKRIISDLSDLGAVSDIQIVSMHWGDEYSHEPNSEQLYYAQLLADLGVNVVIGTHPHVLQPVCWLTGKHGNKTLVLYSLGNLLSAQDEPVRLLGALACFLITYNPIEALLNETDAVTVHNLRLLPIVTHIDTNGRGHRAYLLDSYPEELASQHLLVSKGLNRRILIRLAEQVLGDSAHPCY